MQPRWKNNLTIKYRIKEECQRTKERALRKTTSDIFWCESISKWKKQHFIILETTKFFLLLCLLYFLQQTFNLMARKNVLVMAFSWITVTLVTKKKKLTLIFPSRVWFDSFFCFVFFCFYIFMDSSFSLTLFTVFVLFHFVTRSNYLAVIGPVFQTRYHQYFSSPNPRFKAPQLPQITFTFT